MSLLSTSLWLFLSLATVSQAASTPEHHLQKRQTTVNHAVPLPRLDISRTLDGISLSTVAVVVLALIAVDVIGTLLLAGVAGGRSRSGTVFSGDWDLGGAAGRLYNSIDLVETGLSFAGVRDEACRLKTVCEIEQAAAANPMLKLAINTINSNLSGLRRYQTAVDSGLAGRDCSLLYSQCQHSYARGFTSLL